MINLYLHGSCISIWVVVRRKLLDPVWGPPQLPCPKGAHIRRGAGQHKQGLQWRQQWGRQRLRGYHERAYVSVLSLVVTGTPNL